MDFKKLSLYGVLAVLCATLWNDWTREHQAPPAPTTVAANADSSFVPQAYQTDTKVHNAKNASTVAQPLASNQSHSYILVQTDVLKLELDTLGGGVAKASLLEYPESLKEKNIPVEILNNDPEKLYVAESGLTNAGNKPIQFNADKTQYQLQTDDNSLTVVLKGQATNGLGIVRTYVLNRGDYAVHVNNEIINNTGKTWNGNLYTQLRQKPQDISHGFLQPRTYEGAAVSSPDKRYQKLSYKDLEKSNFSMTTQEGWVAMQQHYFLSAWVPEADQSSHYYSQMSSLGSGENQKIYSVGILSPELNIAPNSTATVSSTLYIGPEIKTLLDKVAPGLDLTIDYGWLWMISEAIFWVMDHINSVIGNWGWSIVLVTILIKLLFYKLSEASYRSMAKMRELQPKIATLRERYGDDRQKLNQAMMELYKKDKINPLGGCLPMIVQIPVFIALYYVLFESVQLRQAPFIGWIHDLSVQDPYYVLPILMGISMFVQQRLSPPPPDPTQAKVMMFLPVVFTVFFLSFPAGLVLYWLVNNCLSVLQQWFIMRNFKEPHRAHKKSKSTKAK